MIKKEQFIGKSVVVTQIKSSFGLIHNQKATIIGLGLRGIGTTSTFKCSDSIFGMIKKVEHLVKVSVN